jgi:uncharacterized repeat protein (TIGR01451 family)
VAALLMAALALLGLGAAPAGAQAAPLRVTLTVDPAQVTVDLSPGQAQPAPTVRYEIVVENLGDDLIAGVEVTDDLPAGLSHPAGSTVRMTVGDLGARGAWRDTIEATLQPEALQGSQLTNVVAVTTAAGDRIESAPAITSVLLISATTITAPPTTAAAAPVAAPSAPPAPPAAVSTPRPRAVTRPISPRPATRVLGVVYTRDAEGRVVADLARTGSHTTTLAGLGLGLVLIGSLLLRHAHE